MMSENTDTSKYTLDVYRKILNIMPITDKPSDYGLCIQRFVERCIKQAEDDGKSVQSTGNLSGRWFELIVRDILEQELGSENITMYVMDGSTRRISDIHGLEAAEGARGIRRFFDKYRTGICLLGHKLATVPSCAIWDMDQIHSIKSVGHFGLMESVCSSPIPLISDFVIDLQYSCFKTVGTARR